MGLFQSKNRENRESREGLEDADGRPQHDAAEHADAPGSGTQSNRRASKQPAHGENEVANIGKSISIKGDLTGNEDLVIEGKVEGKVDLPNNQLTVGANGSVQAEVNAKSVTVVGRVSGNVHGTERVEIQATGIVEGDVIAPRLIVAEGAVLNGAIKMTKKTGAAESPPSTPPSAEVRRAG